MTIYMLCKVLKNCCLLVLRLFYWTTTFMFEELGQLLDELLLKRVIYDEFQSQAQLTNMSDII